MSSNMSEGIVDSSNAKKKRWTEVEKRILLKGLKKYGSKDIHKRIKNQLPHKSVTQITQMVRKYQTIAEFGKKDVASPVDVWMRSGIFSNENTLLPEALLFIQLFEDHPPPEETGGFDLKLAYKLLYDVMMGQPPTQLSRKTEEMFKEFIITADKEMWPANESIVTDLLISKLSTSESDKCYERKRTSQNLQVDA